MADMCVRTERLFKIELAASSDNDLGVARKIYSHRIGSQKHCAAVGYILWRTAQPFVVE
jgi:hypothetical protein